MLQDALNVASRPRGELDMPSDERRYYGLDALRGTMMMLGIVIHAAMFYIASPPPGMPWIGDRNTSVLFDAILAFIRKEPGNLVW